MDRSDRALIFLVTIAVAASVYLAVGRWRIEQRNHTVELIVDADDARLAAAASGRAMPEFLGELRQAGAGALAVREMTVGDLARAGRIMLLSQADHSNLVTPDQNLLALLRQSLTVRLPNGPFGQVVSRPPALLVRFPADELADVPALLRPEDIEAARAAGLRVVARLRNYPAATPAALQTAMDSAKRAGATLVVFDKDEVLGFDGLLETTAEAFEKENLLFGFVEMAVQRGDAGLARRIPTRLVRVHSITETDMLTMTPGVAVPRYARAVQERNVRGVYLRLLTRPQKDIAGENLRYVRAVADAIQKDGYRLGPAAPFAAPEGWPPRWARGLAALGVIAGVVLALRRFVPLGALWTWLVFGSGLALGAVVAVRLPAMVAPIGGLAAAAAFPTLASVWFLQRARRPGARLPLGRLLGATLRALLFASATTFAGAMLIVGLYSRAAYLSGVTPFSGVKLSLIIPLVFASLAVALDLPMQLEPMAHWWARLRLRGEQFLRQPVTVALAILTFAVLAALAFAVSRSGNQPVVSPSALELRFRHLLEVVLAIRPRTKEFLLGHPALMLGVALGLRGRGNWLPLLALGAALGQASLLNTYCHFHTPLLVSLLRTLNGLWLGAICGLGVVLLWRGLFDRPTKEGRDRQPMVSGGP